MIRNAVLLIVSAATCISCAATGHTYYGFRLDVQSAPPPPRVVFVDEPRLEPVEDSNVYVVANAGSDVDMFRYGSAWYLCYDGYWYKAPRYDATFVVVDVRSVPTQVVSVPPDHWKHHPHGEPPGLTKRDGDWNS